MVLNGVSTTTFVGTEGCITGARDGTGADSRSVYCQAASPPTPAGTPIFNGPLLGRMSFNYAFRSIFVIDGNQLRRIE
jgi:hypothetical protein